MDGVRRPRSLAVLALVAAVLGACGAGGDRGQVTAGGQAGAGSREETLAGQRQGGGLLYRAYRTWARPEALSVTVDGLVVRVADTSVRRSAADFTTWRLTPEGVQRLQLTLAAAGLVEGPEAAPPPSSGKGPTTPGTAAVWVGRGGRVFSVEDPELVGRLFDHEWLGEAVAGEPAPWVPGTLSLEARPGAGPSAPAAWPLPTGVRALARGTAPRPDGERLIVCLEGAQVPPVWRLLRAGVDTAHLAVDDGEPWVMAVNLRYPGYHLANDACPRDPE